MTTSKIIQLRQTGPTRIRVVFTDPKDVHHRQRSCLNKASYSTEEKAQEIIDKRKVKLYIYPCDFCKGYHLSRRK